MKLSDMLFANAMMGEGGGGGGSSDFSTAEVTFITGEVLPLNVRVAMISGDGDYSQGSIGLAGDPKTVTVILYKGTALAWSMEGDVVDVTGDATIDDGAAYITGDCTVTFE